MCSLLLLALFASFAGRCVVSAKALCVDDVECNYDTYKDQTNYGPPLTTANFPLPSAYNSFVAYSGAYCRKLCCAASGCKMAVFVTQTGLCYLKTSGASAAANVASAGATTFVMNSKGAPAAGAQCTSLNFDACTSKRGVAYDLAEAADANALTPGAKWFYNWSPLKKLSGSRLEYLPMVWGEKDLATVQAMTTAPSASIVLGFNEPNFVSEANLTPQRAAQLWPNVLRLAKQAGAQVASPAMNYCGSNCVQTDPIKWLDDFFAACYASGLGALCGVDYIAFHSFVCDAAYLNQQAIRYRKYGLPLLLTEFSCLDETNNDASRQLSYMRDALTYLEMTPFIHRYAWFSGRFTYAPSVNLLDTATGVPTALGKQYRSYGGCT